VVSPVNFFEALTERFYEENASQTVKKNCLQIINIWLENFPHDFENELRAHFNKLYKHILSREKELISTIENIQDLISDSNITEKKLRIDTSTGSLYNRKTSLVDLQKAPKPIISNLNNPSILSIDPLEIARQLTLIDERMFQSITPSEVLNQAWTKPKKAELSPNICAINNQYNIIVNWVKTEILSELDPNTRKLISEKFLEVIDHLRELNNYNGMYEIVSAIDSSPVWRLETTGAALKSKSDMWERAQEILFDKITCVPHLTV
jgi:son of sevenless-like protein